MLPPQLSGGVTLTGLHWQGRTFDVKIGPSTTTVTLRGGAPAPLETPAGTQTLSSSLSIPTRRPDLAPTTDAARCKPATATSEQPGEYAEAAVDGSDATAWAPADTTGSVTDDLGGSTRLSDVTVHYTDAPPTSSKVEVSSDGTAWKVFKTPTSARYVRVTITRPADSPNTGVREVVATTK
jgi:hypothetical protein